MSAPVAPPTLTTSFEPPGKTSGTPAGVPPDGPPFQATLETEWARTAVAEGQKGSKSQAGSASPAEPPQPGATEAGGEAGAVAPEAQVAAALAVAELAGSPAGTSSPAASSSGAAPAQDAAAAPPQTPAAGPGTPGASPAPIAQLAAATTAIAALAGPGPVSEGAVAQTGQAGGSEDDRGAPSTAGPSPAQSEGSAAQVAFGTGVAEGPELAGGGIGSGAAPGEGAAASESSAGQTVPATQAAGGSGPAGSGSQPPAGVPASLPAPGGERAAASTTAQTPESAGPTVATASAPGGEAAASLNGAETAPAAAPGGEATAAIAGASAPVVEAAAASGSAQSAGAGETARRPGGRVTAAQVGSSVKTAEFVSGGFEGATQAGQAPAPTTVTAAASTQLHSPTASTAGKGGSALAGGAGTDIEPAEAPGETAPNAGEPVAEELSGLIPASGAGGSGPSQGAVPLLGYGVGLQQAIEAVNASIELAARGGLAQARIALEPEELGEIRIHLTQTASGLLARVTADSPAAAQALAAGHLELRQSLSSAGLSLARLQIGHGEQMAANTGEGPAEGRAGAWTAPETQQRARPSGSSILPGPHEGEAPLAAELQEAPGATRTSEGSLVDVLA
jgi:flagellar hook-length control protein FliK